MCNLPEQMTLKFFVSNHSKLVRHQNEHVYIILKSFVKNEGGIKLYCNNVCYCLSEVLISSNNFYTEILRLRKLLSFRELHKKTSSIINHRTGDCLVSNPFFS